MKERTGSISRLMLIALAAGTAVGLAGTAALAAPRADGKGCVIEYVDERGGVRETKTEPEGTKQGEFVCIGGAWQYGFDRDEFVIAPLLQGHPDGRVTARAFTRPARARALTLGEMADIERVTRGAREAGVFRRAIVALDDGRQRTPEEVAALLRGKDKTGAKILRTIERPDPAKTVEDLVFDIGTSEPVVVYFWSEVWDAITGAIDWVIDGINDVFDWLDKHCDVGPAMPPDLGIEISCRFW